MVQEYLNLEEAARELSISKEALNQKAQRREIRAFADRGTWKFRKQDIEEHARQAGIGSGAEIVFGDLDDALPELDSGSSDQILLNEQALEDAGPGSSGARVIGMDQYGRTPGDSDVRLVPQEGLKDGSDSDVKLVGGKPPSDSDVKVIAAGPAPSGSGKAEPPSPSDSDVRLDRVKAPSDSGVRISTETLTPPGATDVTQDLPVFTGLDDEELLIRPGSSGEQPITAEPDSDFELTPGAPAGGKLGDSDMALAFDDNIGLMPDDIKLAPKGPSDSDVTAHAPSASGINLGSPADSGISLDRASVSPGRSGRSAAPAESGDIFETDFDVPAIGGQSDFGSPSDSDTAQLAADSDFELSGSGIRGVSFESSSQVLSLEGEEEVDESAATNLAAAPIEEEWEEEPGGAAAFEEEGAPARSDSRLAAEDASAATPALAPVSTGEAEWGGVWIGVLSFSSLILIVLGMVMLDLVRTMWGWEDGVSLYSSPILRGLQSLLPM